MTMRFTGLAGMCLLLAVLGCAVAEREARVPGGPLEEARLWLRRNPPDGTNRAARRERMAVLQEACDRLSVEDYRVYARAWKSNDVARADLSEAEHPALRYLRDATLAAVEDIRCTRVKQGVAVWLVYNMGHVFKTPTACFGIDLSERYVGALAPDLDFLLVTHEHADHHSVPLIEAMLAQGKPVVTRWFPGTRVLNQSTNLVFGDIRVRVDIGDHHYRNPAQRDNMLMYEVDCGPAGNHAVIYHSGDGSNYEKIRPSAPIDLFIVHTSVGMPVAEAVRHLRPKMTFAAHLLELGHSPLPPHAWRWSFDYAFNVLAEIPEREAAVLTWGERWLLPGTRLE